MLNKVENKLEKLEESFDNGKIIKDGIKILQLILKPVLSLRIYQGFLQEQLRL